MPEHWLKLKDAATIQTRGFLATQAVLDEAYASSGLVAILGDAGLGKSHAAGHWLEQTSVHAVRITPEGTVTPRGLVHGLYEAVTGNHGDATGTEETYRRRIVDELEGQQWIWVFDEAQWLKRALKSVRGLWMNPRLETGIAFVGGPEFEERLDDEPALRNRLTQIIRFEPLLLDEWLEILPYYHPIWESVEQAIIASVNRRYANGCFRLWANYTKHAQKACKTTGEAHVTWPIAKQVLRLLT